MFDLLDADLLLALFLFLMAWVGHSALMVTLHNQFYGLPTPKGTGKFILAFFGSLTFVFPLALWSAAGWDPRSLFVYPDALSWRTAAQPTDKQRPLFLASEPPQCRGYSTHDPVTCCG